ncbi:MAG TPA: glycerophosphodiester phosphodiesterase [Ilumatobacteraceae bacterium]|nr:glycerophosphodiester phosphodiesterase [Ilumatobacteraceae bacterium]
MQQRLPSLLDPPITFAHRGARAHAPENTLEAFALGLKLGASGLESDVWLTADGVAVLDHDGVVKSGLRKRPIKEFRRDELPAHIPTLEQLLRTCGTHYALSLDLKDPGSAIPIVETVTAIDADMLERTWLCEPSLERVLALRAMFDDGGRTPVRLLQTTRLERIKGSPERRAEHLARHDIDGINLHRTDWNGGLVALVHRFGLVAFGWDLQHEDDLRPALRMGLDAVYSDHVDVMTDAFIAEIGTL